MKKKVILIIAIVIAVGLFALYYLKQSNSIEIGSSGQIDITPQQVMEIKQIGQWEFLQVSDEEVVDTIRKRMILSDDRLVRIYYGTLRLGIDLRNAPDDWAVNNNDTVVVTLPVPTLLDDRFIDEARTATFYQTGQWSASDKDALYNRAAYRMKAFALTPENISECRKSACTRFEGLFYALGAKDVIVKFEDEN